MAFNMGFASGASGYMFEYQAPATLNQAAPVQNTWYDILPATDNVRVYMIVVGVEDVNETLEVQMLIDGETIPINEITATHSTDYYLYMFPSAITRADNMFSTTGNPNISLRGFPVDGHSVQVQMRKTTVAGAGNLVGIVTYGVLRRIN